MEVYSASPPQALMSTLLPPIGPGALHLQLRQRATRWLNNDDSFWGLCTALFGGFAILKGLRRPGGWALTQSQLDYSHGFIKRGLLGTLYQAANLHHRRPLSLLFFLELALVFGLLILLTRRSRISARFGSKAVTTVFASSYAVTYLTHLVGYHDLVNVALALALLLLREQKHRFVAGLVVVPLAMLIHENFLFLLLPVLLFSFLLDPLNRPGPPHLRSRSLLYASTLTLLALIMAFVLSFHASLTPAVLNPFQTEIAARVDFPLKREVFDILARSVRQNSSSVALHMHHAAWRQELVGSAAALLPLFALALVWMRRLTLAYGDAFGTHARKILWIAVLLSSSTPLLMYLVGWDCARWNVSCLLATYLTFLLLSRTLPRDTVPFRLADRNAAILLLAINMASGAGLFDGFQIHPFPFFSDFL